MHRRFSPFSKLRRAEKPFSRRVVAAPRCFRSGTFVGPVVSDRAPADARDGRRLGRRGVPGQHTARPERHLGRGPVDAKASLRRAHQAVRHPRSTAIAPFSFDFSTRSTRDAPNATRGVHPVHERAESLTPPRRRRDDHRTRIAPTPTHLRIRHQTLRRRRLEAPPLRRDAGGARADRRTRRGARRDGRGGEGSRAKRRASRAVRRTVRRVARAHLTEPRPDARFCHGTRLGG